jgi:hypothetical protein
MPRWHLCGDVRNIQRFRLQFGRSHHIGGNAVNQPIAVTPKTLVLIALAFAVLVAGVAVAATALTQPQEASAADSNAAVVKQLKNLNGQVKKTNSALKGIGNTIGYYDFSGTSLRKNSKDIAVASENVADSTYAMCRELGALAC